MCLLFRQLQLLAMDSAGVEHAPSEIQSGENELTAVFPDLDLRDAQCFYIQTRPQVRICLPCLPLAPVES